MKKNVLVNLQDEKSFLKFQGKLYSTWEFNNSSIVEVLERYKSLGTIYQFSKEHYMILRDLVELHISSLPNSQEVEAYIVSKKAAFLAFCNHKGIMETATFIAGILSIYFSLKLDSNIIEVIAIVLLWFAWGMLTGYGIKLLTSPAKTFYEDLFANIEKSFVLRINSN